MVDGAKRLAWVVTTQRLLAAGSGPATRAELAEALRAAQIKADPSRISRWESGLDHVPPQVVAVYESVAGMPTGALEVLRRALVRAGHLEDRGAARADLRDSDPAALDAVVDDIASARMTGVRWLWFSEELHRYDRIFLRRAEWKAATDLLVDELARSSGHEYELRFESAAALMSHPGARSHLSRSIGQYALSGAPAILLPRVLAVLGQVPDGASADLLLRMVETMPDGLGSTAARVSSTLVARGHIPADSRVLETYVGRSLPHHSLGGLPRLDLVDLACRLAEEPFERVARTIADAKERRHLARARATHLLLDPDEARILAEHVAQRAEEAIQSPTHEQDPMLRQLVLEALFHVHGDRRHLSSRLLMASPYAAALAAAVIRLTSHRDELISRLSWTAARRFGRALRADDLENHVLEEHRPGLVPLALACVAQAARPISDQLAMHIKKLLNHPDCGQAVTQAGVVALALDGRIGELAGAGGELLDSTVTWFLDHARISADR